MDSVTLGSMKTVEVRALRKCAKTKKAPGITGSLQMGRVYSSFMQVLLVGQAVARVEAVSSAVGISSRLILTNPKRAAKASAVLVKM